MGVRPDLDLSDILPAYQDFITGRGTSTAGVNRIRATPEGDVWEPQEVGDEAAIPDYLYTSWFGDTSTPRRVGNGPATCSTSQVVALRHPQFAWDVNGWYRTIGVPFPYVNATQGVLSRSYVASGGQSSARATYYLKRLLNGAVRALYDAMPLGQQFLDDDYVQDALKALAAAEAGRRSRDGFNTNPETVMCEWGYKIENSDDTGVDSRNKRVQDRAALEDDSQYDPVEWVYSYWLWRTREYLADAEPLERWQTRLVSALGQRGQRVNIAVGRNGKSDHPYSVDQFHGVWVIFLHEDEEPTEDLASRAADALIKQTNQLPTLTNQALTQDLMNHPHQHSKDGPSMTNTAQNSRFSRGGDAAVEAEEALRASRGGGSFRKTNFLPKIGKDKHIFLRYLTDSPQWIYVDSHSFVPTKAAPSTWPKDKKFPEAMPAVCRYDKAFKAIVDDETGAEIEPAVYTDCYIDDAKLQNEWKNLCKPQVKVYALAILREEVIGTKEMADAGRIPVEKVGYRVGFKDVSREVEVPKRDDKGEVVKEGDKVVYETITEPAIIVVNQSVGNYFGGLQSMFGMYGTVCDRDYAVKQKDEKKDVDFIHMPMEPDGLKPGTEAWGRFEKAIEEQGDSVNIEHILYDRSSDDYYALFFDPSKEPTPREGSKTGGASDQTTQASAPESQQAGAPSNEPDTEMLAQMRERVRNGAAGGGTPSAQTPQEPEKGQEPASATPTMVDFSAP